MRYGKLYIDNHINPITCVNISNDNKSYISCCLGDTIKLTDVSNGQLLRTFKGHHHRSYKIEAMMTPDDKNIITGDENGYIYCWDILTSNIIYKTESNIHNKGIIIIDIYFKSFVNIIILFMIKESVV